MLFIVALDPGETTGWASFSPSHERDGYKSGEWHYDQVWEGITAPQVFNKPITRLVYESFKLREANPHAVNLTPVEVIGVIKLAARIHKIKLVPQTPSEGKGFWSDDRLKEFQLYKAGKPHANDAMRHLLHYLHFNDDLMQAVEDAK